MSVKHNSLIDASVSAVVFDLAAVFTNLQVNVGAGPRSVRHALDFLVWFSQKFFCRGNLISP